MGGCKSVEQTTLGIFPLYAYLGAGLEYRTTNGECYYSCSCSRLGRLSPEQPTSSSTRTETTTEETLTFLTRELNRQRFALVSEHAPRWMYHLPLCCYRILFAEMYLVGQALLGRTTTKERRKP